MKCLFQIEVSVGVLVSDRVSNVVVFGKHMLQNSKERSQIMRDPQVLCFMADSHDIDLDIN